MTTPSLSFQELKSFSLLIFEGGLQVANKSSNRPMSLLQSPPTRPSCRSRPTPEGKPGLGRLPPPPALLLTEDSNAPKKTARKKLQTSSASNHGRMPDADAADAAVDAVDAAADADARAETCLPRYPETSCLPRYPQWGILPPTPNNADNPICCGTAPRVLQAAEPPQSPGSLLYVLYVLYGSYTPSR